MDEKRPVSLLCKFFQELCNSKDTIVTVLTARPETVRIFTVDQLQKHGLTGYDNLIMFQSPIKTDSSVRQHKISARHWAEPDFCIGDMWYDVGDWPIGYEPEYDSWMFIIGDGWLKLPSSIIIFLLLSIHILF